MSDTTFTPGVSGILSAWLNDINDAAYTGLGITDGTGQINRVRFPATQVSSASANDLDDYEEGTFTPVIQIGGVSTGITYTTQVGRYTKIGNRVAFNCYVLLSSKGSATGNAKIQALPFTSQNTTGALCAVASYGTTFNTITTHHLMYYIAANDSGVTLSYLTGGTLANITDAILTNTSELMASAVYETAT